MQIRIHNLFNHRLTPKVLVDDTPMELQQQPATMEPSTLMTPPSLAKPASTSTSGQAVRPPLDSVAKVTSEDLNRQIVPRRPTEFALASVYDGTATPLPATPPHSPEPPQDLVMVWSFLISYIGSLFYTLVFPNSNGTGSFLLRLLFNLSCVVDHSRLSWNAVR